MKYCYLIMFLMSSMIAWAQPTITVANYLEIGEMETVFYSNTGVFAPGDEGENVTWDFSSYDLNGGELLWEALMPDETPYSDSFPSATVAFEVPVISGGQTTDDVFVYYEYLGNQLNLLGLGFELTESGETSISYQILEENPQTVFNFPIEYQDMTADSFEGVNYINVGGQFLVLDRGGDVTVTADAYGTLITPLGTYENVLRVKRVEILDDYFMGFPTRQVNERYTWMSANRDYLLMEMERLTITPFGGGTMEMPPVIYFCNPSILTGTNDIYPNLELVNVYPNPAVNEIHIPVSLNRSIPFEIVDLNGREMAKGNTISGRVDVSSLSTGMYTILFINDQKQYAGRFMKK